MRYTKTALSYLCHQYHTILIRCAIMNAAVLMAGAVFVPHSAMAADVNIALKSVLATWLQGTSTDTAVVTEHLDGTSVLGTAGATSKTINGGGYSLNGASVNTGIILAAGQTLTVNNIGCTDVDHEGIYRFIKSAGITDDDTSGGFLSNHGTVVFNNTDFYDNNALSKGGAVFNDATGSLTVRGQGVSDRSTFFGNSVTGVDSMGGAVFSAGHLNVDKVLFQANVISDTTGHGGALAIIAAADKTNAIVNSIFAINWAVFGGALYNGSTSNTSIGFSDFDYNGVDMNAGMKTLTKQGGAIYNAGTLSVTDTDFTGNRALEDGGAIYNTGHLTITAQTKDVSFSSNTITTAGGGTAKNDIYNTGTLLLDTTSSGKKITLDGGVTGAGTTRIAGTSGSVVLGTSALFKDQALTIDATNTLQAAGDMSVSFLCNDGTIASSNTETLTIGASNITPSVNKGSITKNIVTLSSGTFNNFGTMNVSSMIINSGAIFNVSQYNNFNPVGVVSADIVSNSGIISLENGSIGVGASEWTNTSTGTLNIKDINSSIGHINNSGLINIVDTAGQYNLTRGISGSGQLNLKPGAALRVNSTVSDQSIHLDRDATLTEETANSLSGATSIDLDASSHFSVKNDTIETINLTSFSYDNTAKLSIDTDFTQASGADTDTFVLSGNTSAGTSALQFQFINVLNGFDGALGTTRDITVFKTTGSGNISNLQLGSYISTVIGSGATSERYVFAPKAGTGNEGKLTVTKETGMSLPQAIGTMGANKYVTAYAMHEDIVGEDLGTLSRQSGAPDTPRVLTINGNGYKLSGDGSAGGVQVNTGDTLYINQLSEFNNFLGFVLQNAGYTELTDVLITDSGSIENTGTLGISFTNTTPRVLETVITGATGHLKLSSPGEIQTTKITQDQITVAQGTLKPNNTVNVNHLVINNGATVKNYGASSLNLNANTITNIGKYELTISGSTPITLSSNMDGTGAYTGTFELMAGHVITTGEIHQGIVFGRTGSSATLDNKGTLKPHGGVAVFGNGHLISSADNIVGQVILYATARYDITGGTLFEPVFGDGSLNGVVNILGDVRYSSNGRISRSNVHIASGASLDIGTGEAFYAWGDTTIDGTLKMTLTDIAANSSVYTGGSLKVGNLTFGPDAALSLTVGAGLLRAQSSTADLQLITPTGTVTGEFASLLSNNRYVVTAGSVAGSYKITNAGSVRDIVMDGRGNENNVRTGETWDKVPVMPNPKANEMRDRLNDLSQHDSVGYVNALRGLAPIEAYIPLRVTKEVNNILGKQIEVRQDAWGRSGGDCINTGVWIQGLANYTKLDNTYESAGFTGRTKGFAFGMDGEVDSKTTVGVGYAFNNTQADTFDRDIDVNGHTVFAYGKYQPAAWYVRGMTQYGVARYEEKSPVAGLINTADYHVYHGGMSVFSGYDLDNGFTPESGIRYTHIEQQKYTDSIGQQMDIDAADVLVGVVGVKYTKTWDMGDCIFITPKARLAATYDFISDNSEANVSVGGLNYEINGRRLARFGVEAAVGLEADIDNWNISVGYNLGARRDYYSHSGMIKAEYYF